MLVDADMQDGRGAPPSYGQREQFARALWILVYIFAYRWVPRRFNAWHRGVLRAFGAEIGDKVHLYPSARIAMPWNLQIDSGAVIGGGVNLYSLGKIHIGMNTVVSQGSVLCAGTHDYTHRQMPLIRTPITIGKGCWICMEAFIGPNVSIGDGSVIGARAVVVKNIAEKKVCSGNPCRELKDRIMRDT